VYYYLRCLQNIAAKASQFNLNVNRERRFIHLKSWTTLLLFINAPFFLSTSRFKLRWNPSDIPRNWKGFCPLRTDVSTSAECWNVKSKIKIKWNRRLKLLSVKTKTFITFYGWGTHYTRYGHNCNSLTESGPERKQRIAAERWSRVKCFSAARIIWASSLAHKSGRSQLQDLASLFIYLQTCSGDLLQSRFRQLGKPRFLCHLGRNQVHISMCKRSQRYSHRCRWSCTLLSTEV